MVGTRSPSVGAGLETLRASAAMGSNVATSEERRAGRQAHARPLAEALKRWFEAELGRLSQKSDTAQALRYALRHWEGLTLYLEDGRIEMDTLWSAIASERSLACP